MRACGCGIQSGFDTHVDSGALGCLQDCIDVVQCMGLWEGDVGGRGGREGTSLKNLKSIEISRFEMTSLTSI